MSKPEPKTIAFGGVATGSINAQLAASGIGATRIIGLMPISTAMAPTTGRKVAVVAILLVNSVKKIIIAVISTTIATSGSVPISTRFTPNHFAKPVLLTAEASDKPPPNNKRMLHGNSVSYTHLRAHET